VLPLLQSIIASAAERKPLTRCVGIQASENRQYHHHPNPSLVKKLGRSYDPKEVSIQGGRTMRRLAWIAVFLIAGSLPALAAVGIGYSLFGDASYVSPGNNSNRAVQLIANANTGVFSGIDFAVPANLTINDLNTLSTDYKFTAASCAIGSPRFGITLASNPNAAIFVYIGPPPNYTGCPSNVWANTGNLLTPASLVDATQYGGAFYETWAAVQTQFSNQVVTDIFLVSDDGPAPGNSQTVLIDNTDVNGTLYDYEFTNKNDCKDGGWKNFTFPPGPFKNQGQCVSYFAQQ
jgi:hypothetical protein